MADETDTMDINGLKFVGFRTFFIAMVLIGAYVLLLGLDRPLGGLEGMVSFVLGFMFGNKGAAVVSDVASKLRP
jgi:hypothetical protein